MTEHMYILSVFNKVFKLLVWKRLEVWWEQNEVVSGLQSACKKDMSCVKRICLFLLT